VAARASCGGRLDVEPHHVGIFLERFHVDRLAILGFSEELIEQLRLFGYSDLAAARRLTGHQLRAQFGDAGARLHAFLSPGLQERVSFYTPPPQIQERACFERPRREPRTLLPAIEALVERATEQLDDRSAQRVCLTLEPRGASRPISKTRLLHDATREAGPFLRAARTLLRQLLTPDTEVEAVAIAFDVLRSAAARQGALFKERPGVKTAVEAVRNRFPSALKRAVVDQSAFFEEERVYFEPFTLPE
jgi:nucleotidyltransferase/DNA polymerase involved in DNA repair